MRYNVTHEQSVKLYEKRRTLFFSKNSIDNTRENIKRYNHLKYVGYTNSKIADMMGGCDE